MFVNIEDVAVIGREDSQQNKYLCAYFTSGEKAVISDLKNYL